MKPKKDREKKDAKKTQRRNGLSARHSERIDHGETDQNSVSKAIGVSPFGGRCAMTYLVYIWN